MLSQQIKFQRLDAETLVAVKDGILSDQIAPLLSQKAASRQVFLIIDEAIQSRYRDDISSLLSDADYILSLKGGEQAKSLAKVEFIVDWLLQHDITRQDVIVACGGGAIGDLVGFVASIVLRGVECVQIPTTLLAMVDSSIGGKTAVNTVAGKNLIGSFYQPSRIIIDPQLLKHLPPKQIANGMAEIIKYSLITDEEVIDSCVKKMIENCVKIKSDIVQKDESDRGVRQILNFGHTLGHAIEKEGDYQIQHGEAIALGMLFALKLSEIELGLDRSVCSHLQQLLHKYSLPTKFPKLNVDNLIIHMQKDKKVVNKHLTFILLEKIGQPQIVELQQSKVREVLRECLSI